MSRFVRTSIIAAASLCLLVVVPACGNGDGDGDAGNGADAADAGGGNGDGGNGGNGDGGGGSVEKSGSVTLTQTPLPAGVGWSTSVSATFTETTGGSDPSCSTSTEGNCVFSKCDANSGEEGDSTAVSAGDVSVSGGMTSFTLSPDSNGEYSDQSKQSRTWDGSHTLTLEAAGDTVPGFSKDMKPPSEAELQTPDVPTNGALTVDTSSDFSVKWDESAVSSGSFYLLFTSEGDNKVTTTECTWDATSGSESVPSSLLGKMKKASDGTFVMQLTARKSFSSGEFDIELKADELAQDGDGENATGTADFQ